MLRPTSDMKYLANNIKDLKYREMRDFANFLSEKQPQDEHDVCAALLAWADYVHERLEKLEKIDSQRED